MKKGKKKVSNVMLVIVCIMIIAYAGASFALQYFADAEISPTLTTAWFAFWGTEIISLAGIKISKVLRGGEDSEEVIEEEEETCS